MIQNVFRPSRVKNGKRVLQRQYSGRYRLSGDFQLTQVKLGTSDKQVAVSKLKEIVRRKEQERVGLIPSEAEEKAASTSLTDHLAEFVAERYTTCRSARYVRELELRLKRLFNECSWKRPGDINASSFIAWRRQQNLSAKFLNEFLIGARGFNRWLRLRKKALAEDPLESVDALSTIGRETFKRRSLSAEEIKKLLANSGPRWVLYLLAIYTGLRRNELKLLEWSDVFLEGENPHLLLRAVTTKNGKGRFFPLHSDARNALAEFRSKIEGQPAARVFHGMFPKIPTFHGDLKAAGITRMDSQKRKVDFHTFRYTFCNLFPSTAVSLGLIKEAMRHSDLRLTLNTYTEAELLPLRQAIDALPSFYPQPVVSQIDSQSLGARRLDVSEAVAMIEQPADPQTLINKGSRRDLSQTDAISRENEDGARYRVRIR